MSGTTAELGLATATDTDDIEVYNVTNLAAALVVLDALFSVSSGHDHSAAHKGKPIPASGLAQPLALTSPVLTTPVLTTPSMTTPTVTSGGLTVTQGNVGINAPAVATVALEVKGTTSDSSTYAVQVQNSLGTQNILLARNDGQVLMGYGGLFSVGPVNTTLNSGDLLPPAGATGAVSGFVYIPRANGAPTGTPTLHAQPSAPLYYDTLNHKLWVWDDGSVGWKGVVVA